MPSAEEVRKLKKLFDNACGSLSDSKRTEAFTHISYANEKGHSYSNERLEYLGDAVLQLSTAELLYVRYPKASEGDLTRMRAHLVSGASLADIALKVGLEKHLLLGRGETLSGGNRKPKILAGAMEAFIGAVYLEQGWRKTIDFVKTMVMAYEFSEVPVDAKTRAQEKVQKIPGKTLCYETVSVTGPDHTPTYQVALVVDGEKICLGEGHSKKDAEENAAENFLSSKRLSED